MGHRASPRPGWRSLLSHLAVINIYLPALAQAYAQLSDAALRNVPNGAEALNPHTGSLLSPILVPRVPGTPGSFAVQRHIADFFARELPLWRLEWQNSTSRTPATGTTDVTFSNLIFTRDPPWTKGNGDVGRLALVAHYDSLYKPEGFIGATDSAAPCAILMQVARGIDATLTKKWEAMAESDDAGLGLEDDEKGVQILFLDGEEAWVTWSDTDSLYGARSLAEKWEAEMYPAQSTYESPLSAINLFVLLDLLGHVDPHVPSYFPTTHWAYQGMAKIETRMRNLGLLATQPQNPFLPESDKAAERFRRGGYIADDHVPFMARGVPILHVIPTPFPPTWHTMDDDADHLDSASIGDWAKIVTAFAAEWLELDGFMAQAVHEGERQAIRDRTEL
ncbi:glutaminyl-peptide cyclotransferase [Xylaria bambusicola]|uniref:glutaminyl-peptide cyclotransferase n=1 Tax=Xylaria bambusicola TaxID=326684 RepID=UPI002008B2BA|nr:glutaminyl-peptide cyclotransferase [Xylaria bambusicola]KAI0505830.1 glutaminyl-peptide cyclotransferase [Xylaria bambusicola]